MQNVFKSIEEIQTKEQVDQEIEKLNSQLNKLLIIAIILATGFITSLVLMIISFLPVNIFTISILGVLVSGIITNIKQGREINLQMFILNMLK